MEDIIQKNRICKLNIVYFIIEPELIINKIRLFLYSFLDFSRHLSLID